jgi:hypothetical protein
MTMRPTTVTGIVASVDYVSTTRNGNNRQRITLADMSTGAPAGAYLTRPDGSAGIYAQGLHRGELVTLTLDGHRHARLIDRAEQRDPRESHAHRQSARQVMRSHGHGWTFADDDERNMVRDNCGACVLGGWGAYVDEHGHDDINYAGWQRIYVQTSTPIPARFVRAFLGALDERNVPDDPDELTRYARALRSDLATHGAIIEGVTL